MKNPKVLAITKRIAELCDTQSLLHSAGVGLVTSTNLAVARSVIEAIRLKGVIICRESWSEHERESIISELAANHPKVTVLLRCPGWKRCLDCGGRSHMETVASSEAKWFEPEWAGTSIGLDQYSRSNRHPQEPNGFGSQMYGLLRFQIPLTC